MAILSIDPGAERMGWALLTMDDAGYQPVYFDSGVLSCPRADKEQYQDYRLRLIGAAITWAERFLTIRFVKLMVNETVPAPVGTNFGRLVQMSLATTAITVFHTIATKNKIPIKQISANTVKRAIGGSGDATKVAVRNGVLKVYPELKEFKMQWPADRWDAIAVGLTELGANVTK